MPDLTDREALIRLSTQMDSVFSAVNDMKTDIEKLDSKFDKLEHKFNQNYVTKAEFEPVKKAVYGFIGITLTAVLMAILAFLMNGGGNLISNVP